MLDVMHILSPAGDRNLNSVVTVVFLLIMSQD